MTNNAAYPPQFHCSLLVKGSSSDWVLGNKHFPSKLCRNSHRQSKRSCCSSAAIQYVNNFVSHVWDSDKPHDQCGVSQQFVVNIQWSRGTFSRVAYANCMSTVFYIEQNYSVRFDQAFVFALKSFAISWLAISAVTAVKYIVHSFRTLSCLQYKNPCYRNLNVMYDPLFLRKFPYKMTSA